MRNSFFYLSVILLSVIFNRSAGQTAEQLLERHFEASGQEILNKVTTVVSSGRAEQMGMALPFIQVQQRPLKMYIEIDIGGDKVIQAFDGKNGWTLEPWISQHPRPLTGPEIEHVSRMAGVDSELINWELNGYRISYDGTETTGEGEMHILRLERGNDDIRYYYLDSNTYLVKRIVTRSEEEDSQVEGVTILDDYRDINGVMMPFRTETRYGGQVLGTNIVDVIEFDVAIGENLFDMP